VSDATLASLKDVREFFGMTVSQFRTEWTKDDKGLLTESDKAAIRQGIGEGTFTY
jgi:hypothetical protein